MVVADSMAGGGRALTDSKALRRRRIEKLELRSSSLRLRRASLQSCRLIRYLSHAEDRSGAEPKAIHCGSTYASRLVIRPSHLQGQPVREADVHSAAGGKREARIVGETAMPIAGFDARQSLHESRCATPDRFSKAHATTNAEERIYLLAGL